MRQLRRRVEAADTVRRQPDRGVADPGGDRHPLRLPQMTSTVRCRIREPHHRRASTSDLDPACKLAQDSADSQGACVVQLFVFNELAVKVRHWYEVDTS